MSLTVLQGSRWQELVSSLSSWLSEDPPGVFETVTVVVSSRSVARMLRQSMAATLPQSICAGVEFITLPQWVDAAARRHGCAEDMAAWRSTRLQLAVVGALGSMLDEGSSPILSSHLGADGSPSRRMQLAGRLARLLRRYIEWAPDMVTGWLEAQAPDEDEDADEDVPTDATGCPLPRHLTWQPELLRRVMELLEVDPVETWQLLGEALVTDRTPRRTGFFALAEVPTSHARLIQQHTSGHDAVLWQMAPHDGEDWPLSLPATRSQLGSPTVPGPGSVAVHGSHGPARQVEVLRDELCRRFEADHSLEPRDVLLVCPDPQLWWPHLRTAFSPASEDPMAHPGRSLRLQLGSGTQTNLVLQLIHDVLRLADARATSSDIIELMLLRPVAHRWRISNRRDQVTELAAAAEVRWGLDERHRGMLGLAGVTQNTWLRGLDRLLAGLTLSPETTALPISGVHTVGTSDLELVGTLSELVSRLRKFVHGSNSPATVQGWVGRIRDMLAELVGPSFEDEWMLLEAHTALADMIEHLSHNDSTLARMEFARLFDTATREFIPRPAVGNGSVPVVAIGELSHVHFRLVCMLGIGDPAAAGDADLVNLGPSVPERRRHRQAQLLTHARAADDVLIVSQNRDARTDEWLAEPTAVTSLLRDLGCSVTRVDAHPLHAHTELNFVGERLSFDQHARQAAEALRSFRPGTPTAREERRLTALALTGSSAPSHATVADLHRVLKDPAATFLQSAAAVRIFTPTQLRDELPLQLDGLESWGVQDRLLHALASGLTPGSAAAAESKRESLPPGLIGKTMLTKPMANAIELWNAAEKDLSAARVEHRVDIDLDGLVLQDSVTTHGGQLVHVVASKGIKHELLPWLQSLALAAMGVPARAVVHRMDRQNYFDVCTRREIVAPPADVAHELLLMVSRAFRQGHTRLLPLPLEPALVYAGQLVGGQPDPRQWELRTREWEAPWRFLTPPWQLFYSDEAPRELLRGQKTDRDPVSAQPSAFGAWAEALYVPMLKGGM